MKDKQKRKKERTWAEAARMVLENFSDAPMTPKQILHVIQTKGLKEMRGTAPLACLVTMLHSQVRGDRVKNSIFFKLPGRMSLFTLKKNALQWTKATSESETPSEPAGSAVPPGSSSSTPVSGSAAAPVGPNEAAEQESCDSTETTAAASSGRQRKKAVMMPRVVLTPLKVNGEHVPSGKNCSHPDNSINTIHKRQNSEWPMKRSRGGVDVDFETPGSILVNTNIRALINVRTFSAFPTHSQQQLLQLLPEVDRQVIGPDGMARLSSSALNNEFFTHASQSWKERLAEGKLLTMANIGHDIHNLLKHSSCTCRSGLTREESLKLTMTEASEVTASVLDTDVAVVATGAPKRRSVGRRRRDGRMRRRTRADLRRRARRTLCKTTPALQSAEAEASPEVDVSAVSVGSPMSDNTVVQGEVVLQADCGMELPAEPAPSESKASPPPDSPSASPATTPVLSTHLKEQKRRPDETEAFSSFPEKRPRLDDRQSFRTTIDSVRSEKPQPTTEEPKVPPIRIQLSRIKPPWVKGHPTYQICPRIVPPNEGSRRSGTGGARTLADIKARAQQARAQREAAAAVAASGDGTGPPSVRLRPAAGLPDSSNGRRAREHPGPIEPGGGGGGGGNGDGNGRRRGSGMEEQGSSSGTNSSGTQLQLLNVEATPQPSPSLSTTSTSLSLEPVQTPSPRQDETAQGPEVGEEVEATSATVQNTSNGFTERSCSLSPEEDTGSESSARKSKVQESAAAPSERADKGCEKPVLAPTSIPDSLPRFGAQGVDVIQTLASSCQAKDKEQRKEAGLCGVIQHGSHHVDPQDTFSSSATERQQTDLSSPQHGNCGGEKDDEAGIHSDSTETASDCENESQEDEQQQQPDQAWCPQLSTQRNGQLVICSPPPQNQQPVIQAHVSSRQGQTVIQPRFPNGLLHPQHSRPHSQEHHSLPTPIPQGLRDTNVVVKMEPEDDCRSSRQSSAEDESRGALRPSDSHPNAVAVSKRLASSARPVSSVEANNPLVTQLLQGSLPLEKVLPSHSANRLEISRLPGPQSRPPLGRIAGPRNRPEVSVQSSSVELTTVSPTSRSVSCLMEAPAALQYQSQQAPGAVPVITSLPPSSSSLSSRSKSDLSSLTAVESAVIKESHGPLPSQGATPDKTQPAHQTIPNGPCPPTSTDVYPADAVPTIRINWKPPQSQLSHLHQQQLSPAPTVKNEVGVRPSCQALAKSSPTIPLSVTKKEPGNSVDSYLSGGAMEGLLNMEMTLARMAKKEHSKGPYSSGSPSSSSPSPSSSASSLPFQLYGKLPKQGGGVSYTANVSVMDNSGFSRSMAEGVLQLRPRLASSQTTLSIQAFTDSTAEEVALKCSCRLKAMIMCQGCGAFCHDDCIGPSKLCVSCLVVR
uniref:Putative Polycomb group protein ASXL1 n=1 Tax=Stegastes partitus TaxID=144197 RepID=A0A3B4ZVJ9_9TELE